MRNYRFLVLSDPVVGREAEYNDWYDNVHLGEVLALPGFLAAERYRFQSRDGSSCSHSYLAIYEFETDNPEEVLTNLTTRAYDGTLNMPPLLAEGIETRLYEVITQRVTR